VTHRILAVPGGIILMAAASVALLKWAPLPFACIAFMWGAAAFAAIPWMPGWVHTPLSTLGAIAVALGTAEAWFAYSLPHEVNRELSPALNQVDRVLGWAPKPSQVVHAKATVDGRTLYDVRYSIDATRHRIGPPDRGEGVRGCVYFFADSFTFGEGVDDSESLPYQLGVLTQGRYRIINFSAPGYGAEHMLASLERGELSRPPPCEPTHIVYVALAHHILRAAGKTFFSDVGPRYQLRAGGEPFYLQTPASTSVQESASRSWWQRELAYQSTKSQIRRALAGRPAVTTDADVDLYFAIVRKAFRLSAERWPSAQRHVISWDIQDAFVGRDRFHRGLATVDAQVHPIDSIVPGYTQNLLEYSLDPLDLHPKPKTYSRVAQYLAERVITAERAGR
jgi:hypothetical protein